MKITKQDKKEFATDLLTVIEFAKVLWGDGIIWPEDWGLYTVEWQQKLNQIIMSKNPTKKLKELLKVK